MTRRLRGHVNGEGQMRVYSVEDPAAVDGSVNAGLDQSGQNCTLISATGSVLFFAVDAPVLAAHLRSLADFVEKKVVQ